LIKSIPLILGMSPSPDDRHRQIAFAAGATTTKELIELAGVSDRLELFERFDCANVDELRLDANDHVFISQEEAQKTLDALHAAGQLEERVIILLGQKVSAAMATWLEVKPFEIPSIQKVVNPKDYWGCTICAIDHPRRFKWLKKNRRLQTAKIFSEALEITPLPTQYAYRQADEADMIEQSRVRDLINAFHEELKEEEYDEEWEEQSKVELRYLREYYQNPPYDPDDYE